MAARTSISPQPAGAAQSSRVVSYDFSQPNRIPADQVHALESLHEDFARAVGLSLSAYLRAQVSIGSPRMEPVSFAEFSQKAARPLTTFVLRVRPQQSTAFLQLAHTALFPMLELLLGGDGKSTANVERELTEIENCIFSPVMSIVLQELKSAWSAISPLQFAIEDEGAGLQIMASIPPHAELLAIQLEMRVGESVGLLSLGLPYRPICAVLQDSFNGKAQASHDDSAKMRRLIQDARVAAEVRLNGPAMLLRDLLAIEAGDVLAFDHPLSKELELELNGTPKFKGHIVTVGNKRAFQVKRENPRHAVEATDVVYATGSTTPTEDH
jgi:flagellar motor switch protein FliM